MNWKDILKSRDDDEFASMKERDYLNSDEFQRELDESVAQHKEKHKNMTRQERENDENYLTARKGLDTIPSTIKQKEEYKAALVDAERLMKVYLETGDTGALTIANKVQHKIKRSEKLQ